MTARPARLTRLLAMVPYFQAHRGIEIEQAARDLGVTPAQLTKDLELLFVCGLPGYYPDDLIELEFSEGHVDVGFTAGMDRPLRLTTAEAAPLMMALRSLVDTPGVVDRDAARRAIAKLERAVGSADAGLDTGDAGAGESEQGESEQGDNPTYAAIRAAVRDGHALRLRYYTATRDQVSERVVDPIRLQVMDQNTYLEAWCRSAEGVRLFRFDRVDAATELDEPSAPPAQAAAHPQSAMLSENPELPVAVVEIDPDHLWVFDYYLIDPDEMDPDEDLAARGDADGPVRGRLVYGSPEWLTRFLLGFGGAVRLVGDPGIAEGVRAAARAARARYR